VALTPAQKQKAYRDRLKKRLAAADVLAQELAQAKARILELEAVLARERTRRTRVYRERHFT
jgi:hypothetical protein